MIQRIETMTCDSCGETIATGPKMTPDHRIWHEAQRDVCGRCAVLMLNHLVGRIEDFRLSEAFVYATRQAEERKR